jgi:dolichol kinase
LIKQTSNAAETRDRLGLKYEIARKAIHLSSLSIVVIYCHISRDFALMLLLPLFLGFFLVDILKNFFPPVTAWYHRNFGAMLREHELIGGKPHLNGATCITMSALLLVLFFPKVIAITAFSMVAISDTVAAIVGKIYGRHRFGDKSLEGSAAFFISALIVAAIVPNLDIRAGIVMAITATVIEAFVIRIGWFKVDDNLTIPLLSAATGLITYQIFLPLQIEALSFCR